ncbi:MAG: OmpA family protein [Lewinella sp.]|nr:OmpA family protein [Lewinella sp.]
MRFILTALAFVVLAGSFQSCVSKKKYDELVAAKEATDQALAQTQSQLKTLQEEKDALQAEYMAEKERLNNEIQSVRSEMQAQIAQINEKLNMTEAELQAIKDEINGMFSAYSDAGLTMEEREGRLYLVTDEAMTFRSSSSNLSSSQRAAIDMLAEKLKSNPDIHILVEGHTDNKQFVADSGMDNWDLSVARARAVANRLIRQGVDPSQIGIAGYGENMPAADNGTSDGRAQNRRTMVTPNPDLGGLINAGGGQ